ncbi:MAG: GH92 family glycosyl hydrolase, partial [Tepidisphaeraceae bacterium]
MSRSRRTLSRTLAATACVLCAANASHADTAASTTDSVNVFVGTAGHGHTYPGATVPFGFVQLSPDTRVNTWDGASGYHYTDKTIDGFSHTHLSGTGVGDLGDVMLMPVTGALQSGDTYKPLASDRFVSPFSHDRESAAPGYYRVMLDRYGVLAELTATAHAGMHRYTFPSDQPGHVIVDLVHGIGNHATAGSVSVDGPSTLSGWRTTDGWASKRTVYFVLQASRPWSQAAFEAEGKPAEGKASEGKLGEGKNTEQNGAKGKKIRAALDFPADQAPLVLRIGLSAVSVEAARKNLEAEVKGFDFDAVRDEARRQWEENLSRITITTPNPTVKRTFYSALYHTMLAPTLYNDADGSYRGGDDKVHTGGGFDNYSTFSLWDTFRAEHPLLTVIEPERVNDFVRSSLAFYEQSPAHALPRWQLAKSETNCMIGYHAMPVIYDAYAKGFRDYDANLALQAMQDSALRARNCPDDYEKLGYVASLPPKNRQAASRTLEYSYDDWCIAQMATALGKKDVADHFAKRSQYFLNLFDPSTGFFRGRTASGDWTEHFDPKAVDFNNYTEANAWQYTFFAPHDLPALLKLFGREGFIQKLDECFNQESDIHHAASDVTGLIGQY